MRRPILLLGFLLLGVPCTPARAQSFDLDKDRQSIVSLDGLWRFHPGDNPAWAAPTFNDSAWPLLHSDQSWAVQGYPGLSGYAWYRFTLRVPAGSAPVALLLPDFLTTYTVYVDGRPVGSFGPRRAGWMPYPRPRTFLLTTAPASASITLHIALRVWHSPIWAAYMGGGPMLDGEASGNLFAGDATLLAQRLHEFMQARATGSDDVYFDAGLRGLMGLLILGLFLLRTREREYLWFAAVQLFGGADDVLNFFHNVYAHIPVQLFDLFDTILAAGFWIAGLFFFATVLNQRRDRWFRAALVLALLSPLPTFLYWYRWVPVPIAASMTSLMVLPTLLWVLALLIRRSLHGDPDARLLLLPVVLVYGDYLAFNLVGDLQQFRIWPNAPDVQNYRVHLLPFDLRFYTIFNVLYVMAMLAFLIRRFALARSREEHLRGEFEAARAVQQLLLPEEMPHIPGFQVESVYLPADSVGGDFFLQIPDGQGGLLIVMGDVAGKGLPAAMMVAMLVGAVRTEAAHAADPASLLGRLNARMLGRTGGGFATCLAAQLAADGRAAFANAGHLPPYRNGGEMEIPGSLPLGLIADAVFELHPFQLQPGDTLTIFSDGVVEAQNATGELFGFERARSISTQSAQSIAAAAQAYGQSDDITVLTLTFAGQEVALA
ncbi:MAG TPA: SpoIIE family protein phosphatase [Acidobacteriaceae bacterium]